MTHPNSTLKTLLVGLDAACWEYIDPLLAAGRLPNLAELIGCGSSGVLESVMPPITPAAWSSLVTGVNPGKHGVFEWVSRQPGSYNFSPVGSHQRTGTPVWKRLNDAGIRTGIINIPLTYPVQPLDGFLLCGFSAPSGRRDLAYPTEVLEAVEAEFGPYQPDVETERGKHSSPEAYQAERQFQARQVRIAARLADQYGVQVLITNLMLLDHANHTMPDMATVEQAIIDSDEDLGVLLAEFAPDHVLLISDHGSRRVQGVFLLQAWLAEQGYLARAPRPVEEQGQIINFLLARWRSEGNGLLARTRRRLARELLLRLPASLNDPLRVDLESAIPLANLQIETTNRILPNETRVYVPGGHRGSLAVNRLGREPQGMVWEEEVEGLLSLLSRQLQQITDPETGSPIFEEVYRADEIYHGPFVDQAPELTGDYYGSRWSIVSNLPGLNRRPWRYFLTGERWYGDHSRDGIYVFAGANIAHTADRGRAHLLDIPATLLYLYGVPQPEDFDGRPLQETLRPEFTTAHPLVYQAGDERAEREAAGSDGWEAELTDRLIALGYWDG